MKLAGALIAFILLAVAVPPAARANDLEQLPTAIVTIYPGQTISEAMLADRPFPAGTAAHYPIFADHMGLVGKVARRTLLAGKLIAMNAVGEADVVVRGTIVQATYRNDSLVITAPVLALQAGALNAAIQVRNVDSGKVIVGVVQADGSVLVGGQ